jgi:hypothetical protein
MWHPARRCCKPAVLVGPLLQCMHAMCLQVLLRRSVQPLRCGRTCGRPHAQEPCHECAGALPHQQQPRACRGAVSAGRGADAQDHSACVPGAAVPADACALARQGAGAAARVCRGLQRERARVPWRGRAQEPQRMCAAGCSIIVVRVNPTLSYILARQGATSTRWTRTACPRRPRWRAARRWPTPSWTRTAPPTRAPGPRRSRRALTGLVVGDHVPDASHERAARSVVGDICMAPCGL